MSIPSEFGGEFGALGRTLAGAVFLFTIFTHAGCERPLLARDGKIVFAEQGARGASVITANGVEFRDSVDVPTRIVSRDASEPWRAPIGFILPASGRFTETSRPTVLATTGLAIVLRPSDTRVPSWGGEVLVRIDVLAPAAEGTARWGEDIAVVIDGRGADTSALAGAALAQLGARDRVTVIDAGTGQTIVPTMPARHRSMVLAAIDKHLERTPHVSEGSVARAVLTAHTALQASTSRRLLVLTAKKELDASTMEAIDKRMDVITSIVSTSGPKAIEARVGLVREAIPASGQAAFRDVVLHFAGTPAPSHVLEASGGDVRWRLDAGELAVGDVRAGDAFTEVVRVTVPAWIAKENFAFTVTATFDDVARSERRSMAASVGSVYDDDIERIAESRHGDVIAYASALATLKRLDAAFIGAGIDRQGGLYKLALMHAESMRLLARDTGDAQIVEQADMLRALLAATR